MPNRMKSGDVYICLKGGCAWGLSLINHAESDGKYINKKYINSIFNTGDNDVDIKINPNMNIKTFCNVYKSVTTIVDHVMRIHESRYAIGGDIWDTISECINWDESNFNKEIREFDITIQNINGHQIKRERKKYASYNKKNSAELLDVSIPRWDDHQLINSFNYNKLNSSPLCDQNRAKYYI